MFGTGNETTSLEQVVSEFDFQYRFSNVKDYNRHFHQQDIKLQTLRTDFIQARQKELI